MINVPAERSATPLQTRHPSLSHQNSWVKGRDLISLLALSHKKYALGVKATCSQRKPGRGNVQRARAARQSGCHSSSRELRSDVCAWRCVCKARRASGKAVTRSDSTNNFFHPFFKKKKKKTGVALLQRKKKQKLAGKIFCAQLLARGCAQPLEIPLLMTLLNTNLHIF